MPVAVNQFNKHLATEFNVNKERSLMKQLDHPCFPFVYGICTESKLYLMEMQFCSVCVCVCVGSIYTSQRITEPYLVKKSRMGLCH